MSKTHTIIQSAITFLVLLLGYYFNNPNMILLGIGLAIIDLNLYKE